MKKLLSFAFMALIIICSISVVSSAHAAIGFVERGASVDTPGLVSGLWHGMVAPYALILELFMDVEIYAKPNAGFIYDAGFLLGVGISLPIGWILAIVSLVFLII
ncbi:MAG: hypothetical protein AAB649_04085 [Patescibacteria group bacterium]